MENEPKESYYPENNNPNNNLTEPNPIGQMPNLEPESKPASTRLLGVFELLSMSWQMFLERWKSFLALFAVLIVLQIFLQAIVFPLLMGFVFSSGQLSVLLMFAVMFIMIILFSIPSLLASIAMIEIVKDKNLGVFNALNLAYGKIIPYIKVVFIAIAILVGAMAIFFILFAILGVGFSSLGTSSQASGIVQFLLGIVIIIAMIIMSLIFQVWMFFGMLAVVLEGMRPIAALAYSYELIKGKILSITWIFIVVSALFILIFISIFIALSSAPLLALLALPLFFVAYFVALFVIFLLNYNIYENLKAIKINAIPEDFEARHGGKIKIIAIIGVVIICLFVIASIILSSQFKRLFGPQPPFMNYPNTFDRDVDFDTDNKDYDRSNSNNKKTSAPVQTDGNIKSRDFQRKNDLAVVSNLLWQYKVKNGSYPISPSVTRLDEKNNVVVSLETARGAEIPRDPKEGYYYGYTSSDGQSFELTARLEDLTSADCSTNSGICIYRIKR